MKVMCMVCDQEIRPCASEFCNPVPHWHHKDEDPHAPIPDEQTVQEGLYETGSPYLAYVAEEAARHERECGARKTIGDRNDPWLAICSKDKGHEPPHRDEGPMVEGIPYEW